MNLSTTNPAEVLHLRGAIRASRAALLGSCVGLGLALGGCAGKLPDQRPNVLVVTLDTTRVDALGCYGGPDGISPTIDRFASEGLRFVNAYSCVPLTLPAHSSLFTGRYPDQHGVRSNSSYVLPSEELSLAEILSEEGYQTGAFVAAYVLDHQFGLAQGFEHYDDEIESVELGQKIVSDRSADEVTDRLLAWLDGRDLERPFFAWLHYYDPHVPHELPAGQSARYDTIYHDEVAFVDSQLGRVRARLEERAELAKTLVVLTADHGEGRGEHGEVTHGYFIYQGTQHIPLILSHPSLRAGDEPRINASLVDILPTVLAFLGIEAPVCSGQDLLAGNDTRSQALFMESDLGRITFGLSPLRGVLEGSYKLIDTPSPELYDLARDPLESSNLAEQMPGRVEHLRSLLADRPNKNSSVDSQAIRPGTDEHLQALGYTAGAGDVQVTRTDWTSKELAHWSQLANAGMQQYLDGQYSLVVESLAALVADCPEAYACQVYLGMSLVRTGELERGMQHLQRAVQLQPDRSADVWWDLATGHAMGGDMLSAKSALEQAIAINPGHARALQKLAELALQAGTPDAARGYLQSLLERAPDSKEGSWARRELRKLGK